MSSKRAEAGLESSGSVDGFVLAGGRSSRMGSDKALQLFCGKPMIQNALNILAGVGLTARIAGSRSAVGPFAAEIPDSFPDAGPLGGVHAALSASQADWGIFLPVDMPLMPPGLLDCLIQRAQKTGVAVTVATVNGRMEPFPSVLNKSALPVIERLLVTGESGCQAAWRAMNTTLGLDAVAVENLVQSGQCQHPLNLPAMFWFQSANTPAELGQLNRLAAARAAHSQVS